MEDRVDFSHIDKDMKYCKKCMYWYEIKDGHTHDLNKQEVKNGKNR